MQAMHVAVNMLPCNLIVIFAAYMRRVGKRDEIWLNI